MKQELHEARSRLPRGIAAKNPVPMRLCTHATKWKKVRKSVDVQDASAHQGASAPWTRGNNCPPDQKTSKNGTIIHSHPSEMTVPEVEIWPPDLDKATRQERREILRRIRSENAPPKKTKKAAYALEDNQKVAEIYDFAKSLGWRDNNLMLLARHLAAGGELSINSERYYSRNDGQIYSKKETISAKKHKNPVMNKQMNSLKDLGN